MCHLFVCMFVFPFFLFFSSVIFNCVFCCIYCYYYLWWIKAYQNGGHFQHTLWLSICFLCTWWTLFHTMLDAMGNILRVHYKSMKCDVSFSQGSVNTLYRWGEHVLHVCVNMFFLLTAVQKLFLKIKRVFPELWSQMYCHVFLWNKVYLKYTAKYSTCI